MYACSKDAGIRAKAKECLDSCLRIISRFLYSKETPDIINDHRKLSVGEGSGIAGVLRSLVLINRSCSGICDELIEKAK